MGLKLSEIINKQKTITIEFAEGPLTVTFNPGAFCAKNRENVKDFQSVLDWQRDFLAKCIISWDLADDEGTVLAVSDEVLSALPDPYGEALFEALREASAADPKKGVSS